MSSDRINPKSLWPPYKGWLFIRVETGALFGIHGNFATLLINNKSMVNADHQSSMILAHWVQMGRGKSHPEIGHQKTKFSLLDFWVMNQIRAKRNKTKRIFCSTKNRVLFSNLRNQMSGLERNKPFVFPGGCAAYITWSQISFASHYKEGQNAMEWKFGVSLVSCPSFRNCAEMFSRGGIREEQNLGSDKLDNEFLHPLGSAVGWKLRRSVYAQVWTVYWNNSLQPSIWKFS